MSYLPHTETQKNQMLDALGKRSGEELFSDIPVSVRFPKLALPEPLSEPELVALLAEYAGANSLPKEGYTFLGAGAYRHFSPAAVDELLRRGEFFTAYTPYQPEASQGTLTAIFEFQTMVANLYGMEVANASMYDGATALAEAALMAVRITGRGSIAISRAVNPEHREVLRTYTQSLGLAIQE
ncbi:MAG: glycine dehydrogenase, partial [Chloroflexota bacterium]|nr:glycine dehydrogenase [Chloroflexota bacterium]